MPAAQDLSCRLNAHEHVVELVCDLSGETAEAREAVELFDLFFENFPVGDIARVQHNPAYQRVPQEIRSNRFKRTP